jgi:hypothetical protein
VLYSPCSCAHAQTCHGGGGGAQTAVAPGGDSPRRSAVTHARRAGWKQAAGRQQCHVDSAARRAGVGGRTHENLSRGCQRTSGWAEGRFGAAAAGSGAVVAAATRASGSSSLARRAAIWGTEKGQRRLGWAAPRGWGEYCGPTTRLLLAGPRYSCGQRWTRQCRAGEPNWEGEGGR